MEKTFNYSPRYLVTAAIASKITRIYLSSFPGIVARFSIDPVNMAGSILTVRFIRKTLEVDVIEIEPLWRTTNLNLAGCRITITEEYGGRRLWWLDSGPILSTIERQKVIDFCWNLDAVVEVFYEPISWLCNTDLIAEEMNNV